MNITAVGICTHATGTGLARWRSLADGALHNLGGRTDVPIIVASCNGAADTLDAASWTRAFADLGDLPIASAACASGLHALYLARGFLLTGHAEVIVLAADIISPASHANFTALRVLDDAPAPWQPTSAGFREGEAAVAIRLRRGSNNVIGTGTGTGTGTGLVGPLLGNDNLAELVRAASNPDNIAFVIGQGTGPAAVDAHELAALPPHVPLATALASCGHTIGASGLLSVALAHLLREEMRTASTTADRSMASSPASSSSASISPASSSTSPASSSTSSASTSPASISPASISPASISPASISPASSSTSPAALSLRSSDSFDFGHCFGHAARRARELLSLPFATAMDGRPLGVPSELRGDILVTCRALGGACAVVRLGSGADDDGVDDRRIDDHRVDDRRVDDRRVDDRRVDDRRVDDRRIDEGRVDDRRVDDHVGDGVVGAGLVMPARWVEPQPPPPLRIPLLRRIAALPRPAELPGAIVVRMDAPLVPPEDARVGGRLLPSVVLEITPGFVAQLLARVWGFAGPALTLVGGSERGWVPTLAAIERVSGAALVLCVHAGDFAWGT